MAAKSLEAFDPAQQHARAQRKTAIRVAVAMLIKLKVKAAKARLAGAKPGATSAAAHAIDRLATAIDMEAGGLDDLLSELALLLELLERELSEEERRQAQLAMRQLAGYTHSDFTSQVGSYLSR